MLSITTSSEVSSNEITVGLLEVHVLVLAGVDLWDPPIGVLVISLDFGRDGPETFPCCCSRGLEFCLLELFGDLPYGENLASILCFSLLSFTNHFFSASPIMNTSIHLLTPLSVCKFTLSIWTGNVHWKIIPWGFSLWLRGFFLRFGLNPQYLENLNCEKASVSYKQR